MTMPVVHMVKSFVGLATFGELDAFQRSREGLVNSSTGRKELAHVTRHRPKRADEIVEGGSIFWVMSGAIVARQRVAAFRAIDLDGSRRCAIVLRRPLIAVSPRVRRAFQGWRYLDPKDVPPDLDIRDNVEEMSPALAAELARLGLA